jgi:hypothetical protein
MTPSDILGALSLPGRVASVLPVVVCGAFLLLILASGPPEAVPSTDRALGTLQETGAGEIALVGLGLIVVALLLDPLQLRLVRLLEGDWPRWTGAGCRWCIRRQRARRKRAATGTQQLSDPSDPAAVQDAGVRTARLLQRFPPADATRPTALGNALAAMEHRAGLQYGWDAVVAWPRLYPLLSPGVRAVLDGQRDRLDGLARLSGTAAATTLLTVAELGSSGGWWLALAAIPAVVSRVAYVGSVHTAIAYGHAVQVAFDLNRFDLLKALHLPLPRDLSEERKIADQVSMMWRQGVDVTVEYDHRDTPAGPITGRGGDSRP